MFRRRQKNAAASPATTATIDRPPEPIEDIPGSLEELRSKIETLSERNRNAPDRDAVLAMLIEGGNEISARGISASNAP